MNTDLSPWARVLAAVGGRVAELARRVNAELPADEPVSVQAVHKWAVQVPADRVLLVERLTGVSRHDLRPDVFGPPPSTRTARARAA